MSIIHDALKKAQEERKDRPTGVPFSNPPETKKKPPFLVIGIVAFIAVLVVAYLYIPAFHPKRTISQKPAAGTKPESPAGAPVKPATQKVPEPAKPVSPKAVQSAANTPATPVVRPGPAASRTPVMPASGQPDISGYSESGRRRSKAAMAAVPDDEPIRRIPARRTEDDSINRQYNEGLNLMNSGQMREAQKAFLGVLGRKPDHVEALNNMGVISASLGNRKEAVIYFNKVLEYRPNYPKAYNNIGLVMMSEGNAQLAEEYFRKAVSMEPESLEPYLNLSALLRSEKKFQEAAKALENPLGRNIKDPNLFLAYAVVKDNLGQSDQAIKYYRQYLGLAKASQAREKVLDRLRYLEERGKR